MIGKSVDLIKNLITENTKGLDVKTLYKVISQALVDKALQQKDVIIEAVADEMRKFLERANITEEVRKVMRGMTVNLTVTFDFKDNPGSTKNGAKKSKSKSSKR